MQDNIKAFNRHIDDAKKLYASLDTAQPWDSNAWAAKGVFASIRKNESIVFDRFRKIRLTDAYLIENRDYIDWMKAVATNIISKNGFAHAKGNISILKHLYFSLNQVKPVAHPMFIDDSVLEHLDQRLTKLRYKDMSSLMVFSISITKNLKAKGVLYSGLTYESKHKKPLGEEQKKLNQRRKQADTIDDKERDGEDACISMRAIHSLAWLSQNVTDKWELVGIRLYHILIGCGFRIGEILRLKADALTYIHAINETTGKPILDQDGNHELIWGIHYHPEKGAEAAYKWLDKTTAPLISTAFNAIKETTEPCREQLRHLESSQELPIRWPQDTISYRELQEHFVAYRSTLTKNAVSEFKKNLAKKDVFPVAKIADPARLNGTKRIRRPPKQPVYHVSDLNRYYFEKAKKSYRSSIHFTVGSKPVCIKTSELLFVTPHGALANPGTRVSLNHLNPTELNIGSILQFFGCGLPKKGNPKASIFNRYDLKEEYGSDIKIPTHAPRHQLNTFLALAKVTEHQQAIIMGRKDIEQNRAYQHLSLEDKTSLQVSTTDSVKAVNAVIQTEQPTVPTQVKKSGLLAELGITPNKLELQQRTHCFNKPAEQVEFMKEALEANSLLGELQDTFNTIKKEQGLLAAREFVEVHGRNFHIVPNGACTRNLSLHGCIKQLRCLQDGGCVHLAITGRPGELESIEKTYYDLELNVAKMDAMVKSGQLRTKRQLAQVEKEKHNQSQMAIVLKAAQDFSGYEPIRVFSMGKRLNYTKGKDTVIARFSEDQRELESKENG